MTSLQRIIGLPVIGDGKNLGYVERGVLTRSGKKLEGLVVRRGLGSAKWIGSSAIVVIGERCVLVCAAASRMPKTPEVKLSRVLLTSGENAGMVTDALLSGETLQVKALEVSNGPVYRLLGRKAYATVYRLRPISPGEKEEKDGFEIIASQLHTWAELMGDQGKEEGQ